VENLSNFRAVESLLQESFTNLQVRPSTTVSSQKLNQTRMQRTARQTDRALNVHVPYIDDELDKSADDLLRLSEALPNVQTQISDIRHVYDSGREKVCPFPNPITSTSLKTIPSNAGSNTSQRTKLAQYRVVRTFPHHHLHSQCSSLVAMESYNEGIVLRELRDVYMVNVDCDERGYQGP
jgi:hypothetical protein